MNYTLLIEFIALTLVNVILQTMRSLCTIKAGKFTASLVNAVCYGVYTVVIVYTMCELPLAAKVLITAACNFAGVFIVKLVEEHLRKDRLWKIEGTVLNEFAYAAHQELRDCAIPHNYVEAGPWAIFNCYCATQDESIITKKILDMFDAKYFVAESKVL